MNMKERINYLLEKYEKQETRCNRQTFLEDFNDYYTAIA